MNVNEPNIHEHDPKTGKGTFRGNLTAEDVEGSDVPTDRIRAIPKTATEKPGRHRKGK